MIKLGYIGGKEKQAPFMETLFPTFKKYVEPFSGTFKNFLHSDINVPCEYNDLNYCMVNLMKALQNPTELIKEFDKAESKGGILYCPIESKVENYVSIKEYYREFYFERRKELLEINNYVYSLNLPLIEVEIVNYDLAVLYVFMIKHSYSSIPLAKSFNFSVIRKGWDNQNSKILIPKYKSFIDNLKKNKSEVEEKVRNVKFFCGSAFDIISKNNNADTFMVIDPGYVGKEWFYEGKERDFTNEDIKFHTDLANILKNSKIKFMLCYYIHPLLESLYPRDKYLWISKDYNRPSSCTTVKGTEYIILNYMPNTRIVKAHFELESKEVKGLVEYKRIVLMSNDSNLYTRNELLETFNVSDSDFSNWLENKKDINEVGYWMKLAWEIIGRNESTDIPLSNLYRLMKTTGLPLEDIVCITNGLEKNKKGESSKTGIRRKEKIFSHIESEMIKEIMLRIAS